MRRWRSVGEVYGPPSPSSSKEKRCPDRGPLGQARVLVRFFAGAHADEGSPTHGPIILTGPCGQLRTAGTGMLFRPPAQRLEDHSRYRITMSGKQTCDGDCSDSAAVLQLLRLGETTRKFRS